MHLTWIFDLDNTLHNASHGVFPRINQLMLGYIMRHLGLDADSANALRQYYYQHYGATLRGMALHHHVDPATFLEETHPLSALEPELVIQSESARVLARLPGRKLMLSNGPQAYIERVAQRMGFERHFEDMYGIERVNYITKPDARAFLRVLGQEKLDPRRCVMVEDSLDNLRTARKLGMKTVWISSETRRPSCVDYRIRDVSELLRLPFLPLCRS
ncbi:pyrimidine 5'-nucleotidase [Paludibacterium paludis]|uniref:Pyrimidine 5'-nucleotidase n=1 Tax=Paludibacterium paludis TaxID=1225769 RepID=A0A918P567_9NEIS|nr:pyrimidine 5'-nucleotidase [Paludibacterium paludis]GGY18698.1 pyrimidine 5'-nucleotidase [Paludibacterium paludis]